MQGNAEFPPCTTEKCKLGVLRWLQAIPRVNEIFSKLKFFAHTRMTHISETRLRRKSQTSDEYALVQTVQLFRASKNINEPETTLKTSRYFETLGGLSNNPTFL